MSSNDDVFFDMFMMGIFDDHSSPKRSGGGCAGCIFLTICVSVLFKVLLSPIICGYLLFGISWTYPIKNGTELSSMVTIPTRERDHSRPTYTGYAS